MIAVASATHKNQEKAPQAAATSEGLAPLELNSDPTGVAPNSVAGRIASLKLQDSKTIKVAPKNNKSIKLSLLKSSKLKPKKTETQASLPEGVVKGRVSRLVSRLDSKNSNLKLDQTQKEVQDTLYTIAEIRERAAQRDWENFGKQ